ncbi:flavocytochrome c [Sedimentibacter hydroxybenzoicus DSM 7310]|uniref:Urocanate reductase n=1 Tax=Sedimentibacter hydroxybenzoicus DSM 7310 TaxID=1123245 RepID=A0A974BGS3_SEDHY|nr:flavocytochrome c [Sedimentibacter hydroxybenzoicus]NYB72855.1 flavocytochrome c [Sedimentibacter hydroxybenzoicus DSM 7310]
MKRIISLLLIAALALSLVGCNTAEGSGPDPGPNEIAGGKTTQIKDGVYEGTGFGKGGEIRVEVTIREDAVTDIKTVSHNETPGFDNAIKTITENIISENTPDVDIVSGCTLTSNGVKEAVNAALISAGATKDMLRKTDVKLKDEAKKEVAQKHDIVIIGAGGAGITAAIEAKEAGADVIILEKMPMAGGNTLISGAEYAAANNWLQKKEGIEDNVELHVQDTLKGGDYKAKEELVRIMAENALAGAEWLRDEVGVVWEDELMFFGGHSVKRSLIPLGASGREIVTKLVAKAEELEIPILLNTKATALITDESGKVIGVEATSEDTNYTFNTNKAVIIASGGFGSNVEMRVKYNFEIDETILSTNTTGSTGDGIVMAEEIGANLLGMEYIQTYPICDPLTGTLLYYDDARLYGHTIIANKEGKRFVEELGRRDEMSMAIKAQTGNVCYELLDQNGFVASKLQENHGPELEYLYKNELLVKADTLEEAADFFGIDAVELQNTVDRYNSYVDSGNDPEFNKRSLPSKIEVGPFYILKAAPAVHHTMGGIEINENAQVLDKEGNVIDGLFAAGEVTGGIQGNNRLGSNALADITVFGRIAGQNAAK